MKRSRALYLLVLASLTALLWAGSAWGWTVVGKWTCCGKNPLERVQVRCADGRQPVYVKYQGRWCLKRKGQPDGAGPCYNTLDQAAKAWCQPKPAPPREPMPSSIPSAGNGWKLFTQWKCCGTNPRQRVQVRCNDGRVPTYVYVKNRWCLKRKGSGDEAGPCYATLDQAAQAWCLKKR
ncbi:MAG: hypothetical protein C4525_03895 [Desulfarculus sp.]|nr:MAG: hypothetical protein C4525_03895 [Desulfarculus sp.]